MKPLVEPETIAEATTQTKKPEVVEEQKLDVRYHVEHPEMEDRPRKFLEAFAGILKHTHYGPAIDQFSRTVTKCGRCATESMIYQATGDPKDIPCYRASLLLDVYRRYFTLGGKLRAKMFGGYELTDEKIEEMAATFWNCTACRKCSLECPMGVDHGIITHLARYVLSHIDIVPRALVISTREQLEGETRNTSAFPWVAVKDSMEFLEEEIEEEKGISAKFPVDVEGSDYVFFAPVSDYMMEAESLMGIATVLHATGGSWTVGSQFYDSINYGLFYSDSVLGRVEQAIHDETERLKGRTILIGECGHASRSAKAYIPTFCGGKDALPVVNIMEYTYGALQEGKFRMDPDVVTEVVTYHDPCNLGRQGWIVDKPREIIKAFCKNYVEMTPSGMENICCGGGGGTVSVDEVRPFRTKISGKAKAEQIRATGAKYCIAPCANCKKQLREVMEDNDVDCEIVGLHDLIYKAIILDKDKPADCGSCPTADDPDPVGDKD